MPHPPAGAQVFFSRAPGEISAFENPRTALPSRMMRSSILALYFVLSAWGLAGDLPRAIPTTCRQLVLVTAPDWDSSRGILRRLERSRGSEWREIGEAREVLLGERGLAWGLGLHRLPPAATRRKLEGDRRGPAGVFDLPSAFGRKPAAQSVGSRLPYRQLAADTEAVDDPSSRFYNRIVQRGEVWTPDWKSSERMMEIADYDLGVVVAHNPRNLPGAGSCIFLHEWLGERAGTAGCTALRAAHLLELLRWLDADKHPVLAQLPQTELPAVFP